VLYEGEKVGHDKTDLIVEGRVIIEVRRLGMSPGKATGEIAFEVKNIQ
jgi:hypothetical protein